MRSYNSLNSRILNTSLKNSNTLANNFQAIYLGNAAPPSSSSGNADLSSYALKTYVDGSLTNYALISSVYSKSYFDTSFNSVNTRLNTLTNGASESLDTLAEISTAIRGDASFGIVVYQKIASSDSSINDLRSLIGGGGGGSTQDPSINAIIAKNTAQDASINNVYVKSYIDSSFNGVYTKSYIDSSFNGVYTKSYIDSSFNGVYTKSYIDNSFNGVYTKSYIDNSFNGVYVKSYIDSSFNGVYAKSYIDSSFNGVYTKSYIDNSFNGVYTKTRIDSSFNAIYTSDISFSGNVRLGSGTKSVAINKDINSNFALDISGSTNMVGNLSVTKNPSDANYSYFDLSSVNINIFNAVEKFATVTFNATSMTLNYSQGSIFYTTATANFAALVITNLPTTLNRSITVTLITAQSGTFYFSGTAVTVNGSSISYIKQDGTAFAAPAATRTMVVYQFNIIYASATPTVIGTMIGFS